MPRSPQTLAAPLLATVALASLAACRQPEMQRCVDDLNHVVDDTLCGPQQSNTAPGFHGGGAGGYHSYYGGSGSRTLGSTATEGSLTPIAGHTYSTGTSRGGFGSTHAGSEGEGGGAHGFGGEGGGGHGGGGGE